MENSPNNKNSIFNSNDVFASSNKKAVIPQKPLFVTKPLKSKREKMINDFDSSLILEKIDKTVKNKAVRISLKISTLEKNLATVEEELSLLELLKLPKDAAKREDLIMLKAYLITKINNLKSVKQKFGIYYFVSGFLEDRINFEKFKEIIVSVKNEIKKYDKIAANIFKSSNNSFFTFK